MRFVMKATLGVERFAFSVERSRYSLAEMSRLGQQIIDVPQSFSEHRGLQRIHGDRAIGVQSLLPVALDEFTSGELSRRES